MGSAECPSGDEGSFGSQEMALLDHERSRYPFCIVWTPIPMLTWLLPFVGHMGIATSSGIIRDFAGPYYVSEDCMAFGKPTKYWPMDPVKANGGGKAWDRCVQEASDVYKERMHNLFCDNCHSHVAMALNKMQYNNSGTWNMIKLSFLMLIHGKYVSVCAFLKTWLPFVLMMGVIVTIYIATTYSM